jgi:predicted O-methyltransferase YrrM
VNTPSELNLDVGWRITESAFRDICGRLRDIHSASMIEFGSGASTVRWALEFPDLQITSIEHDANFLAETRQHILSMQLGERVKLLHCPLAGIWIAGRRYFTYQQPAFSGLADCVLVDGPPGMTRRGREACLYFAYDFLKVGGIAILDDVARQDEQRIVKNWTSVYPGSFEVSFADVGNELAILTKLKHSSRQKFSPTAFMDNYRVLLSQLRRSLAAKFTGTGNK